jgi:hypothetical protein
MRWLRLAAPALVLAAWWAGSVAQQPGTPPAGTPPPASTPPPRTPPASAPQSTTPRPATPAEQPKEGEKPPAAAGADAEEEFIPTEELQPDAAVTFPVDI